MKRFVYEIRDQLGIHARPAGLLAKEARKYESRITIAAKGKSAEATRLMAVMGMAVKCKDQVTVTCEGEDEERACRELQAFFEANL